MGKMPRIAKLAFLESKSYRKKRYAAWLARFIKCDVFTEGREKQN